MAFGGGIEGMDHGAHGEHGWGVVGGQLSVVSCRLLVVGKESVHTEPQRRESHREKVKGVSGQSAGVSGFNDGARDGE